MAPKASAAYCTINRLALFDTLPIVDMKRRGFGTKGGVLMFKGRVLISKGEVLTTKKGNGIYKLAILFVYCLRLGSSATVCTIEVNHRGNVQ